MSPELISLLAIIIVWLIVLIITFSFSGIGIWWIWKAYQHNHKEVPKFLLNIIGGVAGGLVVAFLLEIKDSKNIYLYFTMSGLIIFVVGMFTLIGVNFFTKKQKVK